MMAYMLHHLVLHAPTEAQRGKAHAGNPKLCGQSGIGHTAEEVRARWPATYQWVLERVKPERDHNNRASYRDNWWIFGEPRKDLRPALVGLPPQVGPFTTPNTWIFHGFVCVVVFLVSRSDPAHNAGVRAAFEYLIGVAARHGWGEYRTGPAFQDAVRATYSFNDHALLRFQEKLKDAVDPKGILAAGRYGLWPRALRRRPS